MKKFRVIGVIFYKDNRPYGLQKILFESDDLLSAETYLYSIYLDNKYDQYYIEESLL